MKTYLHNIKKVLLTISCIFALAGITQAQNVFPASGSAGIGTITPNASAILELKSTTKGFLLPKLTKAQRDAIVTPVTGLIIYQTDNTKGLYHFDGNAWKAVTPANSIKGLNNNIFIGQEAGDANTNGFSNIAIGKAAMNANIDQKGLLAIGDSALYSSVSGQHNTAIGYASLKNSVNTSDNTALGYSALYRNINGASNTAIGNHSLTYNTDGTVNTATGSYSLYSNTTGSGNVANGYQSLYANTTGYANVASGTQTLLSNTTGTDNTATGYQALKNNTIGYQNVAVGSHALLSNTAGFENTALGAYALEVNSTGSENMALGFWALRNNTTGFKNQALGVNSLGVNTTGSLNTAIGYSSLKNNTTASNNVAIGSDALFSNLTGAGNTATGNNALRANSTGNQNTANGYYSLYMNTSGEFNAAMGYASLYSNTTGSYNTSLGVNSLNSNTTGYDNSATGYYSLYNNTTGYYNSANGYNSLLANTIGFKNVALGTNSGAFNDNNTNCTYVGYNADQAVLTDFTNSMALGNTSRITASNQVRIGNPSVSSIGGYANWSDLSDGRYKRNIAEQVSGMAFIRKLRPVTYNLDVTRLNEKLHIEEADEATVKLKEQELQSGFIAQEVEAAAASVGYQFSGIDKPKNTDDLYGLRYSEFVVPMVKGMQEMDQETGNLKSEINILKRENENLREQIEMIKQAVGMQSAKVAGIHAEPGVDFSIAPNPAKDVAVIHFGKPVEGTVKLSCMDAAGKVVKSMIIYGSDTSIDTSRLPAGTYLVRLTAEDGSTMTRKLVVQK